MRPIDPKLNARQAEMTPRGSAFGRARVTRVAAPGETVAVRSGTAATTEERTVVGTRPGVRVDELAKRAIDVVASAAMLALLSPLIFALAIAVKLDSRGPAFYGCRRVGVGGREF